MGPKDALAYVLLSGGIDSSTCVSEACLEFGRKNVHCVSIDYGQRHKREIEAAIAISMFYGRTHEILKIPMPRTMLTDPSIEVPNIPYSDISGVSPTYVPFRNGLMLSSLASHVVGKHLDPSLPHDHPDSDRDVVIYFGAHAEDAKNWAYPDCTPEFIGAMANALYIGTYYRVRLIAPWAFMTKDQIIERGNRLGTPYHLTWSCYKGGDQHCGTCSTCRARKEAFEKAEVDDPTSYLV